MNQSMIIWCLIAGILLAAFILRAVMKPHAGRSSRHTPDGRPHSTAHLLELGEEKDMFFIPGDFNDDDRL